MAEKILKKKAAEVQMELEVQSAGIMAFEGLPASGHAQQVMQEYGMSENHQTQRVTKKLLEWSDLVLTMTEGHRDVLIEQYPEFSNRIFTLKEYSYKQKDKALSYDVEDPFGGSLDIYRKTALEIEQAIDQWMKNDRKSEW